MEHGNGSFDDILKAEWEKKQEELKRQLICKDVEPWQHDVEFAELKYVGGVDLSFVKGDTVNACACLVVCSFPDLKVVYCDCRQVQLSAPYISGFLAFREVSFLVECIHRLKESKQECLPQIILVDGNGILHPREFGVACHLGVLTDMATIGIAKKLFHVDGIEKDATHAEKITKLRKGGDTFPLIGDSGKIHGMGLRVSDEATNPVFVSVGHRIGLETAVQLVHRCCLHRIPEPIRQADMRSREFLREIYSPKQPAKQPRLKKKSKNSKTTEADVKQSKINTICPVDNGDEDFLDGMSLLLG